MEEQPKKNIFVPVSIIIAAVLIAAAVLASPQAPRETSTQDEAGLTKEFADLYALKADDHLQGDPLAPIRIIEYSDYQCPACKTFHITMRKAMEEYGRAGKIAWVYRHFPLDSVHIDARPLARASECATELGGETAFWAFTNYVMGTAGDFIFSNLSALAKESGVPESAFKACISAERHDERVERDFAEGVKAGVGSTPTAFIIHKNGRVLLVPSALPYETEVRPAIEDILRTDGKIRVGG